MRIKIKTGLIELELKDETVLGKDDYVKHSVPEIRACIESAVTQAIDMHQKIYNIENNHQP